MPSKHDKIDPAVKCPFYKRYARDHHKIVCEGPRGGVTVAIQFSTELGRAEEARYMERYCCSMEYPACIIAAANLQKYSKGSAE